MLNNHCFELTHSRRMQEPSVPCAWAGCAGNQHCCRHRGRRDGGRRQRCGGGTRVDPTCCIANVLAMQRAAAFQLGMTHCCRQISIAAGTGADLMAGQRRRGGGSTRRAPSATGLSACGAPWASHRVGKSPEPRARAGCAGNQYSCRHGCRLDGRRRRRGGACTGRSPSATG